MVGRGDGWLAYQFDAAVSLLGRYLDNKVQQYDDKGEPKHELGDLLSDRALGKAAKYASIGRLKDL